MSDPWYFREQAKRCRERAKTASDSEIARQLDFLADRYEEFAEEIEMRSTAASNGGLPLDGKANRR